MPLQYFRQRLPGAEVQMLWEPGIVLPANLAAPSLNFRHDGSFLLDPWRMTQQKCWSETWWEAFSASSSSVNITPRYRISHPPEKCPPRTPTSRADASDSCLKDIFKGLKDLVSARSETDLTTALPRPNRFDDADVDTDTAQRPLSRWASATPRAAEVWIWPPIIFAWINLISL